MILAAASALVLLSAPAPMQAPSSAPAAQAPSRGLAITEITAFLTAEGLSVGPVQQDGARRFVSVTDGPLRWLMFFQACDGDVCADLQYSFAVSGAGVSLDAVNRWNRERRFLKAFHEPGSTPDAPSAAAVQFDVVLNPAQGVTQLADSMAVWRGLVTAFPAAVSAPPAT